MMPLILPATESYSSSYSPSQICCTLLKLREHAGIIIMMHSILNFEIAAMRFGWKKSTLNEIIIDKIFNVMLLFTMYYLLSCI